MAYITLRDVRFMGRFQRVSPPQGAVEPDNVSPVAESDKIHKRPVTPSDVSALKKSRRVNRPK